MKVLTAAAAICLAAASITTPPSQGAGAAGIRAPLKGEGDRKLAPIFELQDRFGKSVKTSDYRGKVLLLNFWATWCGGCKVEIPWFQEFESTLGPGEFAILGVSVDEEGWAAVKPYVEKTGVTYRMVLADKSTANDYSVTSMPATFLIDRKGRIAATYIGLVDRTDMETNIKAVLAEHQVR